MTKRNERLRPSRGVNVYACNTAVDDAALCRWFLLGAEVGRSGPTTFKKETGQKQALTRVP